jgi:UDP-2,3-diacylglucosamine pyrophosphatase LpxH
MIWCYDEKDEEVASEYVNAMALFSGLEAPLFFTPGNHEHLTAFAAREFHRVTKQKEWFSFDHKGAHFIVLNTELSGQQGDITGGQRAWLEEDLNRSTNARAVFVVMHRAMYSRLNPDFNPKGKPNMVSMERRDGLADLFSRHRVSAVFCGHEHLYAKTVHKGVTYFTIGGGGAPFAAPVESGGFLSYMIVTVKGRDVAFDLMEPYHFFVRKRTFREKGKTVGEAVVENICNDDCVLRLRGIKLTLPAADYRLEADTVPPSSQLGDWAIKVNAAITAVKKSRRNHREVDVHITVDSPGAYVLRLTVRPAAGRASPHLRTRRIAPESLCAPQLR